MTQNKFFTTARVNSIRNHNRDNKIFRKDSTRGCALCFLTYVEGHTGNLSVCNLCDAKATQNAQAEDKPINTRF